MLTLCIGFVPWFVFGNKLRYFYSSFIIFWWEQNLNFCRKNTPNLYCAHMM